MQHNKMGIRHLNRFLRENCKKSISFISLSELSGKYIAIDISIYLYKYEAEGCLLENIYLMLSIFRKYDVIPIFIFDGKPPKEKKALLQKRRENREESQKEFNKLKIQLLSVESEEDKQDLLNQMDILKTQIVKMNKDKIDKVKELIRAYGATYYDAPGEADELCASLVINNKVWACLSEDMDLFVYGCHRVLRYFSLINHTIVLYNMEGILGELNMCQKEFKDICILSGTDYNINVNSTSNEELIENSINLINTLKLFKKYRSDVKNETTDFYGWLQTNTKYITNIDLLMKIHGMFNLECNHDNLKLFKDILIANGPIRYENIKHIMKEEGFLYI
jgi:flap endonuclease-1